MTRAHLSRALFCWCARQGALTPPLCGWMAYFKLTETKKALEELDGWIRHKLRCILWRQWKRPYTRAKNLMKAG
ncbi:MAG: group II intron maturase-specific domain-containing protein, partial [Pseudomonadota bacterium]